MNEHAMTRRQFLRVSLAAGGAMLIEACTGSPGVSGVTTSTGPGTSTTPGSSTTTTGPTGTGAVFTPSVWVQIDDTGAVTVTGSRTEMGQGILTAMAMLVADELDADWAKVTVLQADADSRFGGQDTGGSTSVVDTYRLVRRAGAVARQRLVAAAADRWDVDPSECTTADGEVRHEPTGRTAPYGELVAAAALIDGATLPPATLKDPVDFRIVGTPLPVAHTRAVVDGSAIYGSDIRVPGMRYAAVAYSPTLGGEVRSFDAGPALAVAGVENAVEIPRGMAVVADTTWAALQGRRALEVAWDTGPRGDLNSSDLRSGLLRGTTTEFVYDHPFYAHASMEPMSCVIAVGSTTCEVWAPVQLPRDAQRIVAAAVGLAEADVTVHIPMSGGRFGRGLHLDYVEDAAAIAAEVGGAIKLVWTREDDIRGDRFHPLSVVTAISDQDDPFRTIRLDRRRASGMGVPTGYWRSVEGFTDAFAHECYFDELATALGTDPVQARLDVLRGRAAEVVRVAAREAGWGRPLPDGWGRGIAHHATWGTTQVAEVAEVSVVGGEIRVQRVVCAVDCGLVVNPDTVRAQMEGGIVFGLTAALKSGIDVVGGKVVQSNFHDYPLLRFDEMPQVDVHIVASDEDPSGIGEMAVPPLAPAVANAVFAATGRRLRSLPLRLEG